MMPALAFAAYLVTLLIAHQVADHWVQREHQAVHKGDRDRAGATACARHVASYTATLAAFGLLVILVLHLPISPAGFLAGHVISAVSHYWADRRYTLKRLAELVGKGEYWDFGAPRAIMAYLPNPADDGRTLLQVVTCLVTEDGQPIRPERGELAPPLDNPSTGTGAYTLDQSFHWVALFLAALVTVLL